MTEKTTTVQKLELGQQDREVWYRGKKVVKVVLVAKYRSYPYRLTFSDGTQDFAEAADIVTRFVPNHDEAIPVDYKRGRGKLFKSDRAG